MPKIDDIANSYIEELAKGKAIPQEDIDRMVEELRGEAAKLFGPPRLPRPGESVAVSDSMRTAALFFDRVWQPIPFDNKLVEDLFVFGATDVEIWTSYLTLTSRDGEFDRRTAKILLGNPTFYDRFTSSDNSLFVVIANELARERKISAVPVYSTETALDREFHPGNQSTVVSIIQGMGLADEDKLTWDQVLEFREDKTSFADLRRMRHWLDAEMAGKSIGFVQDEIGVRLERYEAALKKHGIETVSGVISDLLDEKFLLGVSGVVASAGVSGGALWAALTGAGLTIGKATVSLSKRMMDLKDRTALQGSEVAFVHELKKLTK